MHLKITALSSFRFAQVIRKVVRYEAPKPFTTYPEGPRSPTQSAEQTSLILGPFNRLLTELVQQIGSRFIRRSADSKLPADECICLLDRFKMPQFGFLARVTIIKQLHHVA